MGCQYKVRCHLSIRTGKSSPDLPQAALVDKKLTEKKFHLKPKSVILIDIPQWKSKDYFSLDKEAKRLGVTRQSIIKIWIAERLQKGF